MRPRREESPLARRTQVHYWCCQAQAVREVAGAGGEHRRALSRACAWLPMHSEQPGISMRAPAVPKVP